MTSKSKGTWYYLYKDISRYQKLEVVHGVTKRKVEGFVFFFKH